MPWEPYYKPGTREVVAYARDDINEGDAVMRGERGSGWWWDGRRFDTASEAMEAADLARGEE